MFEFLTAKGLEVAIGFWSIFSEMAPYLIFGFLFAGLLHVLIPAGKVERHLGGEGPGPVVKASLFGIPLPLCSCGVIPVAASLRKSGAGRGATTSFLLSTPQTGVDSILVTYSLLGPVFALFRPLAALVTGLVGGALVSAFGEKGAMPAAELGEAACGDSCGCGTEPAMNSSCADDSCSCEAAPERGSRIVEALRYGLVTLPADVARPLVLGLLIAGLITALTPEGFFAQYLGGGVVPMLVMMAVGLPLYVCATASVPVAAALILSGVSPGAALVFLMTGPATNAATVTTIWKLMGKRTAVLFLATVAVTAVGSGLLFDWLFTVRGLADVTGGDELLPPAVKTISALFLIGLLARVEVKGRMAGENDEGPGREVQKGNKEIVISISGIDCPNCGRELMDSFEKEPGVESAVFDVASGKAVVIGPDVVADELVDLARKKGYKAAMVEGDGEFCVSRG